jgi:hypothetical protein
VLWSAPRVLNFKPPCARFRAFNLGPGRDIAVAPAPDSRDTASMKFPKPLPHGPITEVFPDVFVVRGTIRFMPLLAIARNMTIVRDGDELTVINSVRLSAAGEAELRRLGAIKRLVRLGNFHGMDDRPEGPTLRGDFDRLLQLEFRHLLSGHGDTLRDRAADDLKAMVARTFA